MRKLSVVTILLAAGLSLAGTIRQTSPDKLEPRKMLYSYLLQEAQKHFDARRKNVAGLKTPEEIVARQKELKAKFLAALGGFPARTPLNPKVVGKLQGDGFRVEKVIYESRPNHHVTAVLYLPESKGPVPGVLVPCGHSANGKAAEAYQRVCILMAKNGLAVLCYDPIGQGERYQILDKTGKPAVKSSTAEHSLVGIGALLVGQSTATYRIWDGIRSLDYLASRPEVDAKRLGCTGNSGGGTLTAYLMALDDRIVAAAPSCYITSLERLFATIGPQDAEQNITGQVAFGMEHADYLTLRAPRPTLMCVATRDFFDIGGAWRTFREAKLIYGKLGHGERMSIFEFDDKHGFSRPRREAAMRWMRRWLLHKDDAPREGDFPIFSDAQLQCTRSGQVLEDFKGKSVFHFNADVGRTLEKDRNFLKLPREKQVAEVTRFLAFAPSKKASLKPVEVIDRGQYQVRRFVMTREAALHLAVAFFEPKEVRGPAILYLSEEGIAQAGRKGGSIEKLVLQGRKVVVLEPRGMGEAAPAPASGKPSYFGADAKEAFLALHLGRPLLGQRVDDVLHLLPLLPDQPRLGLIGVGSAGPIALHAAALDSRFEKVTLKRSLAGWSILLGTPVTYNQLTNVVPAVLKIYDMPELASLIAPRPLTIRDPVDGRLQPLAREDWERIFAPCREVYVEKGAGDKFLLPDSP